MFSFTIGGVCFGALWWSGHFWIGLIVFCLFGLYELGKQAPTKREKDVLTEESLSSNDERASQEEIRDAEWMPSGAEISEAKWRGIQRARKEFKKEIKELHRQKMEDDMYWV